MQIPSTLSNYNVFKDGSQLIGLADVTLPHLQNLTDQLKGAGIFGEIEMPVQAHFQSMTVMFKWLSITDDIFFATIQNGAQLDCWASVQGHDSGTNQIVHDGWRVVINTAPKSTNFGKLEVGTKGDLETEYEVISMRIYHNDGLRLEVDKENAICRSWDGSTLVDSAAQIRQQIGL
jgi:hypothetical protein